MRRRIVSSKRRVATKRESVRRIVDEIVLQPECLKQYASLTGTPYRKSAGRLRRELLQRGKLVRQGRSYLTITVWAWRSYRVHVRREEDGMEGYRLERLESARSSNTGKRSKKRRPPKS